MNISFFAGEVFVRSFGDHSACEVWLHSSSHPFHHHGRFHRRQIQTEQSHRHLIRVSVFSGISIRIHPRTLLQKAMLAQDNQIQFTHSYNVFLRVPKCS